jgi:3-phosphoshikimate 1-carboxyvinyltransferase
VKESDRLAALAHNLGALGVEVDERPGGLVITGRPDHAPAGAVAAHADHRIAMAFGALGMVPGADVRVDDPAIVAVSYPGFWDDLARLRAGQGVGA